MARRRRGVNSKDMQVGPARPTASGDVFYGVVPGGSDHVSSPLGSSGSPAPQPIPLVTWASRVNQQKQPNPVNNKSQNNGEGSTTHTSDSGRTHGGGSTDYTPFTLDDYQEAAHIARSWKEFIKFLVFGLRDGVYPPAYIEKAAQEWWNENQKVLQGGGSGTDNSSAKKNPSESNKKKIEDEDPALTGGSSTSDDPETHGKQEKFYNSNGTPPTIEGSLYVNTGLPVSTDDDSFKVAPNKWSFDIAYEGDRFILTRTNVWNFKYTQYRLDDWEAAAKVVDKRLIDACSDYFNERNTSLKPTDYLEYGFSPQGAMMREIPLVAMLQYLRGQTGTKAQVAMSEAVRNLGTAGSVYKGANSDKYALDIAIWNFFYNKDWKTYRHDSASFVGAYISNAYK